MTPAEGEQMFERFTEHARQMVVLSQEEARALDHDYIGTEHLLLGLLREEDSVAGKALAALGISLDTVRQDVVQTVGRGEPGSPRRTPIPFTPQAKRILELALREALQLGDRYIGTEHVLLGIVREGEGVAARVLAGHGADLAHIRQQVARLVKRQPEGAAEVPRGPERQTALRTVGLMREITDRLTSIEERLADIERQLRTRSHGGGEQPAAGERLGAAGAEVTHGAEGANVAGERVEPSGAAAGGVAGAGEPPGDAGTAGAAAGGVAGAGEPPGDAGTAGAAPARP